MEAIIFDLDDTLCPIEVFVKNSMARAANYLSEKYGKSGESYLEKLVLLWNEKTSSYPRLFNDFLKRENLPETEVQTLVGIYNSTELENTKLPKNSRELLMELRKQKLRIGILTDGNPDRQVAKTRVLGLDKMVDAIVLAEKYGTKTKKAPFEIILKKLRTIGSETAYIGDNPLVDFKIPKELGMKTIRLVAGEFKDIPSGDDVDVEIKDIKDVLKEIGW